MTKETRIPKSESRDQSRPSSLSIHSSFMFGYSFGLRHLSDSPIPLQEIHRQRFERHGFATENSQRAERAMGELLRNSLRFLHPDDGWISGLLRCGVLARRLAESFARLRDIEDVVDDLKRQSDVVAEVRQRLELRDRGVRAHSTKPRGAREQSRRLAFVNVFQLGGRNLFAFALKVGDLAGDELPRAGSMG